MPNGISKNQMDIMDTANVKNMDFKQVNYDELNIFLNGQNIEYQSDEPQSKGEMSKNDMFGNDTNRATKREDIYRGVSN